MKKTLKLLILEDSAIDAEIVQRSLKKERLDCQFHLANNKEAFLEALVQFNPDVILADNSLPQFDAKEALKIVRQQALHIPFIMVTGTVSEEFAAGIIKLGADDYILKDRLTRLPSAIEAALKHQLARAEKQSAFQQLKESEEKFRGLLESAPDAMVILNNRGIIELVNAQTEKMFGYTSQEMISEKIELLMPARYLKSYIFHRTQYFENPKLLEMGGGLELFATKKNGQEFPVEISLSPLEIAGGLLITAAIRDITERKKAEKALQGMEQEILNQKIQEQKKITRAVISAQEQERNRIGQELHDNINQILVAAKLYMGIARKKNPEIAELVKYPMELIDNSIDEIRSLSSINVTPLKNINLKELIEFLVHNLNSTTSIKIIFVYHITGRNVDDDLKLNVFRIIQEQLNNIVKHSDAKNASISIEADASFICIAIVDDGKGFDINAHRNGIGISNMINRIESFNGEIQMESAPGNGCSLEIRLPYRQNED